MKAFRLISVALLLAAVSFASATTPVIYAPGSLSASCSSVTTTGACTPLQLAGNSLAIGVTWQLSYDAGTASSISVTLQGSNDNSTWATLDTNTACLTTGASGCSRSVIVGTYKYLSCNVGTYSLGTTDNLTCSIVGNPNGGNVVGSSSQTVNAFSLWSSSNALGQAHDTSGTFYYSGGGSFNQRGITPNNVICGIQCWQEGMDHFGQEIFPIGRDEAFSSADTDVIGVFPNNQQSTLSGNASVGATALSLTTAETMGAAIAGAPCSGNPCIQIGSPTDNDLEICGVTAGSGSTTLTLANCKSLGGSPQAGTVFAHTAASGELVIVQYDQAHLPTMEIYAAAQPSVPNFVMNLGGSSNETTMGQLSLIEESSQTADIINEQNSGLSYIHWVNKDGGASYNYFGSSSNQTITDLATNSNTTVTSASAPFSYYNIDHSLIVATGIPAGDWITAVSSCSPTAGQPPLSNCTTATLNAAATTTQSGESATITLCQFCVANGNTGTPTLMIDRANHIWLNPSVCIGAGCTGTPAATLQVEAGGTGNATFQVGNASQASMTMTALGSGNDWFQMYTNNRAIHLGVNSIDNLIFPQQGSGSNGAATVSSITPSVSNGTGTPAGFEVNGGVIGSSSGSTPQTNVIRHYDNDYKALTSGSPTTALAYSLVTLTGTAGGTIRYSLYATDGTNVCQLSGSLSFSAVLKTSSYTSGISTPSEVSECSSGTLTDSWTWSNGNLQITPTLSLTATTFYMVYSFDNNGNITVTP